MATFTFTCDLEEDESLVEVLTAFHELTGFPFNVSTAPLELHDFSGRHYDGKPIARRMDAAWRVQY